MASLHPPQGKRQSWKGKQAVLVLDSLSWQFARVLSLKASLSLYVSRHPCHPLPCTLPILLHSKAWPQCSLGICMGQSKIQHSPKSPSRCTCDGSTWAMPRRLPPLHFLCPRHPSSLAGADLLPGIWHTVSLGPARAIMAAPTTVPPIPGSGKRISAKGSSCGSCSHPVVQAPRVRSRAAPRSPGYRMITSLHSPSTRLPAMQGYFLCFGKTRGERDLFWHVLARPEAVRHLHRLGEEPYPLPAPGRRWPEPPLALFAFPTLARSRAGARLAKQGHTSPYIPHSLVGIPAAWL